MGIGHILKKLWDMVGHELAVVPPDRVGNETEVPMDDLIDIGVFAPGGDQGLGGSLYLQRQRIRSGEQTIQITVPSPKLREGGEPARAGIDPYNKLIDRERNDNVVMVKAAGADRVGAGR